MLVNSEPTSLTGFHALINQAHLTMWERNYDLAFNLYKTALDQQPDNLIVSLFMSKALYRMKNYD